MKTYHKFTIIIVWCLLLPALVGVSEAQKSYQELTYAPLTVTPPQVERQTLANGMQLFLVEDHELPLISISVRARTGRIYEPADKVGLASITAEVMRSGGTTQRRAAEINATLDLLAATVEFSIGWEYGIGNLQTLKEHLDTGLDIFADLLMNPAFDQQQLELAKAQRLNEIRGRNDEADGIAFREFWRLVYGKKRPLGRIKQIETINSITQADLLAFHRAYFHPNNIMLAVTGDFDTPAMIQKLNAVFQEWKPAEVSFPAVETASYEFQSLLNLVHKDLEQTFLIIGHLGMKQNDPDYPAMLLLNSILGGELGFSNRLMTEVRAKRGLAYTPFSVIQAGKRDYGIFYATCATQNETAAEALEVMLAEIKKLTETEVSDEELQLAKNQYSNSFVFKFETVAQVVQQQIDAEYFGYSLDFQTTLKEKIMQLTQADLLRVAQKHLHPDKMVILAVGNTDVIKEPLAQFGQVQELELDPTE